MKNRVTFILLRIMLKGTKLLKKLFKFIITMKIS
jgi:hypothetical protein